MKFLADENIPLEVVNILKSKSFDIKSVTEIKRGLLDEGVLVLANKESRVLVTFDTDFGELIFRLKKESKGVILLRVHPKSVDYINLVIEKVLSKDIDFQESFCVVDINRIRIIPLK